VQPPVLEGLKGDLLAEVGHIGMDVLFIAAAGPEAIADHGLQDRTVGRQGECVRVDSNNHQDRGQRPSPSTSVLAEMCDNQYGKYIIYCPYRTF
jgi:hypothetical protein